MSRTIIDIHVLQTVPPSNLNRDDTGSPKTAQYGGVRRARVSSQAWKRSTRAAFPSMLDASELGVRTKRIIELVSAEIKRIDAGLAEHADDYAKQTLELAGFKFAAPKKGEIPESGALTFLSAAQIGALADAAVKAAGAGEGNFDTALKELNVKAIADQKHSIDIALFGRMVADLPSFNVDAAAQVAHAISVHAVDNEFDYFTAVDDAKDKSEGDDAGAAMIGTVEFNSATLYRYATVDVDRLQDNLGDMQATRRAVDAFIRSFITSMPTGKQNTFANRTLPDAIVVSVSGKQSVNLAGAFEDAVQAGSAGGRIGLAAKQLAEHADQVHAAFGTAPERTWVVAVGAAVQPLAELGQHVSLDQLVDGLGDEVDRRLSGAA